MTVAAQKKLADQVLALPEKQRAKLAGLLLKSLPEDQEKLSQKEWDEAWDVELKRRITEIETGKVKCIPYAEVRKRLNRILREA